MSVESKIKELLGEESIVGAASKAAAATSKDNSKAAATAVAGDTTPPMQGSSQKASYTTHDEDDENLGAKNAASVSKDTTLPMKGKGDAKSVKTQAMEETESEDEEVIQEVDIKSELSSIFGDDLSEEFRTKATSIFEAAVIARVNSEMERIVERLEEQNTEQLQEYKETMVEKVDSYLNYVVEQWMEENTIAVDNGLRTEITEEFISGLKNLFKESYIEVPEEKFDVLDTLTNKVDELEDKLNESINDNIEMAKQYVELKKKVIFEEETDNLASTEVEKLGKLIEGVEFDSEELYREKVAVIKENYFPKEARKSAEQVLAEDTATADPIVESSDIMSKYVQTISRAARTR